MEDEITINDPEDIYGMNDLYCKEEVYNIISFCFEVHKILGRGFLEIVYKDALIKEFNLRNIPFSREKKMRIEYKGEFLDHYYIADFIVYDKIVLEIKSQQSAIEDHYKQVINYLAVSKLKLGLIVNFGENSLKFKRVVL